MLLPVLYSFRRCPYAIRARYVLAQLDVKVSLREVVLKSKPEALLALGSRSTVPQLIDTDGQRYPESMDIIYWALERTQRSDLKTFIWPASLQQQYKIRVWITYNDQVFKYWLDRYKYADRHPEFSESYYRDKGCIFLQRLNKRLSQRRYLFGEEMSLVDMALFPFIRQFAGVDRAWFDASSYENVKAWLESFTESSLFKEVVMPKLPPWEEGCEGIVFP
ncbi:glutathione S-transferase [Marinomonas sp. C2222]|uniref:Glutathione S-transferase n=1 Tax=Marinomonas sargassi TaxID=2984494 RepID=A0ABT2YV05_9GAMM|nr:glutathione S-transferase [Marinomonas sargassi]